MSNFDYDCPHCNGDMSGSFGDDVTCTKCNKTYETEWDYIDDDNMTAWLTGVERDGRDTSKI